MENNYPRVTSIIKSVFPMDLTHIPDSVLQPAIDFGNAVHKMVELYIKGTLNMGTLDDTLNPYLEQFKKWLKDSKIQILGSEKQLTSEKYKFKGSPDIWGKIKGRLSIVDIKTTMTIAKTIGLQLSGYEILVKEHLGTNIVNCDRYVLRLSPDKYEFLPFKRKSDMSAFLACMFLNNYRKEVGL